MNENVHDVTALAVIYFTQNLFKRVAEKYGGDCTVNEVRVINQIICCHLEGGTCTVTALHMETGIPIPTVSRCVTKLRRDGWLSEGQDQTDGRKRVISLGPRSKHETLDDISEWMRWINDFREHGLPT